MELLFADTPEVLETAPDLASAEELSLAQLALVGGGEVQVTFD